ncbi:MAG: Bax inhibitor-1 family protein [Sodalis sp. (in: enterobacteria)]
MTGGIAINHFRSLERFLYASAAAHFLKSYNLFGLIIAQFTLIFITAGMINHSSWTIATSLFMLDSWLTGLTLTSIFIVYTSSSIASSFLVTAGMFGATILYSYITKRDLSSFSNLLFVAFISIEYLAEERRVDVGGKLHHRASLRGVDCL